MKIKKILIANRGEIAVRIIKTARKMGIECLAIYAPADKDSLFVRNADFAVALDSNSLSESYLNIEKIVKIAKTYECDAIHPGYGFLAENPDFEIACTKNDIIFIGPKASVMKLMGNKIEARRFIKKSKIPLVEGIEGTPKQLKKQAKLMDFPLLIKAAAGGGGKGMRIVHTADEIDQAIEATAREALNYFGNDSIYIEKYIENPRHIEVQILADHYGNFVHLFDRECSVQRRYQKIIEEAPSPTLSAEIRKNICAAARKIAYDTQYTSVGTIEFLADNEGENFYFLEMNTRIQVEHTVSEAITGIDIIEQQIRIAEGETLGINQNSVQINGHAIECRIYAENPADNFMPSPGQIEFLSFSKDKKYRLDTSIDKATRVESFFDPMISKIIVHEKDRNSAIHKMLSILNDTHILGIETNIAYLKALISDNNYQNNNISTNFCDKNTELLIQGIEKKKMNFRKEELIIAYWLFQEHKYKENAQTIWQSSSFLNFQHSLFFKCEKEDYSIVRVNENTFLYNNVNYVCTEIEFEDLSIQLNINNNNTSAKVFSTKKQEYIYTEGYYFSISNESMILSNEFEIPKPENQTSNGNIKSPMPGKVIKVHVSDGQKVKQGDVLVTVEAMKMENAIKSTRIGIVKHILTKENDMVDTNKVLLIIEN